MNCGLEGVELVVVMIDALGEVVDGGFWATTAEKDRKEKARTGA